LKIYMSVGVTTHQKQTNNTSVRLWS